MCLFVSGWVFIYLWFFLLPFILFLSSPFLSLLFWCTINVNFHVYMFIMRDEKKLRKKDASNVKQTTIKANQHSTPKYIHVHTELHGLYKCFVGQTCITHSPYMYNVYVCIVTHCECHYSNAMLWVLYETLYT